jgi:hypothetical protein
MKRSVAIVVAASVLLVLAACAAGSPDSHHAAAGGALSQLVLGFWHGVIAPITLLIEVIRRFAPGLLPWPWHLYEASGTGVPYDVGFFFGITGGPTLFWSRRRRVL